jgi:hypothetical protein
MKTPLASLYTYMVYNGEGNPVRQKMLSEKYNANVYEARLSEYGIDRSNGLNS